MSVNTVSTALIDELVARAASAPRGRANHNLHPQLEDPVQRLLNAIEPGSYIPVHRHVDPERWELFAILVGRLAVLTFDEAGRVIERLELATDGGLRIAEIPAGAWHSVAALEAGTVVLEIKSGPYVAMDDKGFAPWCPREGDERCPALTEWLSTARPGDMQPL